MVPVSFHFCAALKRHPCTRSLGAQRKQVHTIKPINTYFRGRWGESVFDNWPTGDVQSSRGFAGWALPIAY